MKTGGIGGANTSTGLAFERDTNLADIISKQKGYVVIPNDKPGVVVSRWIVEYNKKEIGEIFQQHGLYRYFDSIKGYNWRKIISKKIKPDDSIFVLSKNTIYIIEKKYQQINGSVDEKLQTCDFKKKQYEKLFAPLNKEVEFAYLLNKTWFDDAKYKDTLDYIISVGCKYYFDYIPLGKLGLPIPKGNK
jgi:Fe-S cluster assembly iron-binding protein IscA